MPKGGENKNHAPQIKKAAWEKKSSKKSFFLSITHKWPFDKGLKKTNQKQITESVGIFKAYMFITFRLMIQSSTG